jgi:predicted GIY-YIG superfamily endonuclease
MYFVYSIHFEPAFKHARHYVGLTGQTLADRLSEHKQGKGSKITSAAVKSGINLQAIHLLGIYDDAKQARQAEKRIKNNYHGNRDSRICPICYLEQQDKLKEV